MKFLAAIIFLTAFAACISRTANANHTHENTMNEAAKIVLEPISKSTPTAANIANFWAKVGKRGPDDCWLWTHSKSNGYGRFVLAGKAISAHRASWIIHNGGIPNGEGYHGTCVLHKCDVRNCVNPAHLFLGTQKENIADMVGKKRVAVGGRASRVKLAEEQVAQILSRHALGDSKKTLAAKYGVNYSAIWKIVNGRNWAHIQLPT